LDGLGWKGRDIYLMVATTAGTVGDDNQGEYSEQKIEKKAESKEAKDGVGEWEN